MKGDFSRDNFHPSKHYTGVLRQQGRVDLDSDWNEETQILQYLRGTLAADSIGQSGAPRSGGGFAISLSGNGQDLTISPGRIYVEGTLCELEAPATYLNQPDYPDPPALDPENGRTDLVYLDVWQRHLSAIEDPSIREPSLGGPDTTTRLQTVWQVKVSKGTVSDEEEECRAQERPGAWVVSGRVIDAEGRPVSGLRVQVFDRNFLWDDLIETTDTDENGCFEVVYDESRFRDYVERAPDLYVRVRDRRDRQLYRSPSIRCEAGRVEYFPIVLGEEPYLLPPEGNGQGGHEAVDGRQPDHLWTPPESGGGQLSTRAAPAPWTATGRQAEGRTGFYRGDGNHLYRVEIHRVSDGDNGPTFKWSRDNGSRAFRVQATLGQNPLKVRLESLGGDPLKELRTGDWVEVLSEDSELIGQRGHLAKIDEIHWGEQTITLNTGPGGFPGPGRAEAIRRWDQKADDDTSLEEGACPLREDTWIELEDGVQIRFQGGQTQPYRAGDYWTFTARSATRTVEELVDAPPQGIRHHYCRLALITWHVDGGGSVSAEVHDWRWPFRPLTATTVCTVTVGDGRHSTGDFGDIRAAIRATAGMERPVEVCILPGQYDLQRPIQVAGRDDLTIRGCSAGTRIRGPYRGPALRLVNCERPMLKSLSIEAWSAEAALEVNASRAVRVEGCLLDNATGPALVVSEGAEVEVASSRLDSDAWIQASGVRIAENRLSGVWIRDGSSRVLVRGNEISSGWGPGVALGVLSRDEEPWAEATGVTEVEIVGNRIIGTGNSGIVTVDRTLQQERGLGGLEDITIADNKIVGCAWRPPTGPLELMTQGGVVLSEASGVRIHGNRIANNGKGPACGIFLYSCQDLDVTGNVIEENGAPDEDYEGWRGQLELRAGIAALFVPGASTDAIHRQSSSDRRRASWASAPAACIRDNTVGSPAGHALVIIAAGSVLVSGNSLISRGATRPSDPSQNEEAEGHLERYLLNRLLQSAACVLVYNVGRTALVADARPNLPRFRTDIYAEYDPEVGIPSSAFRTSLPDGRVLFHDNQVTLQATLGLPPVDFLAPGAPRFSAGSVALFSSDDVSLQGNQVLTEVAGEDVFANVVAVAPTVRASGNRFTELPGQVQLSYLSMGRMGITTENQATHGLFTWTAEAIDVHNHSWITGRMHPRSIGQGDER
jgi:hypothetical protein